MSNFSGQRTELSSIGEFGLIDRIRNMSGGFKHPNTLKSIGDDAAVIKSTDGTCLLLSTDLLAEGVHFDLSYMPLKHLGYKAVSVNVSDIAAMNGKPDQLLVSLALSNRFSVEAVEELYSGMLAACEDYSVEIVGGDTTSSKSGLVISITVLGKAQEQKICYRSGAMLHDLLCVSGDLGAAFVGLQLLAREKAEWEINPDMTPQLEAYDYLVMRQLKPTARMDMVYQFESLGLQPTSMMDISDGLASELFHLSKASGLGFRVYEDKLPIDQQTYDTAREFGLDPTTCMMNGGEDYELVFTLPQSDFEKVKNHPDISIIGHTLPMEEGLQLMSKSGQLHPIQAQGWRHF
jgi:thiamine-monophosphate kinase